MKWLICSLIFLVGVALSQEPTPKSHYEFAVTANYYWGLGVHLSVPLAHGWEARASFEGSYRPERDRFSPQVYSLAIGSDALYRFSDALELPLPGGLDLYAGTGVMVSYNLTTFVYRPFFAVRATPFIGVSYKTDSVPEFFLELGPEIDFTPHFNVSGVDIHPKVHLGAVIFEF